jgi:hypothetical protein
MKTLLRIIGYRLVFPLILVFSCFLCTVSAAEQRSEDTGINASADTVDVGFGEEEAQAQKGFNWFGIGIIGIALGSFGTISLLKFSWQKRKELGNDIDKVNLMIEGSKAVYWEVVAREEHSDPMEMNVLRKTKEYDQKVQELETRKKALIAETSRVAVELMRIWG